MTKNTLTDTQQQASLIAKGTQKPGQTKEQTKLITQGIEKGIAEYKKQQKLKARQRDKEKKKQLKHRHNEEEVQAQITETHNVSNKLPWSLLALSWISFALYFFTFS